MNKRKQTEQQTEEDRIAAAVARALPWYLCAYCRATRKCQFHALERRVAGKEQHGPAK